MKPEQQRIAIAEACGWSNIKPPHGYAPEPFGYAPNGRKGEAEDIPDYLNDLNAMHEAEKTLIARGGLATYEHHLRLNETRDDGIPWFGSIHATASQRAESFLRTLNLWKP